MQFDDGNCRHGQFQFGLDRLGFVRKGLKAGGGFLCVDAILPFVEVQKALSPSSEISQLPLQIELLAGCPCRPLPRCFAIPCDKGLQHFRSAKELAEISHHRLLYLVKVVE
ncbi:hypothetical protein [Aestuariivirga sp.]|uniref:hypothetical protein n=1 Tax=Aestuariivirga sp. TaxID=2650926 RepID=UPI00391B9227